MSDRLYRSRDDRMLAGVAGGLARTLDADPSIVRVVWVLVTFLSGGIALIVYLVMAVVVPEAPDDVAWPAPSPTPPTGPVPAGSWLAPDGRIVPRAEAPVADGPPGAGRVRGSGDGRRLAIVAGVILILLGGLFLIREFVPAIDLSTAWPLASIGFGLLLVILSFRRRRA